MQFPEKMLNYVKLRVLAIPLHVHGSYSRFGVIEAVYQFCVEEDWELLYLTLENAANGSFAVRKISQ